MRSIYNEKCEEYGVSPVIGVILIVAITVILAAVVGVMVFGFGGMLEGDSANEVFETSNDGTTVTPIKTGNVDEYEVRSDGSVINTIPGNSTGEAIEIQGVEAGKTVSIVNPETEQVIQQWTVEKSTVTPELIVNSSNPDNYNEIYEAMQSSEYATGSTIIIKEGDGTPYMQDFNLDNGNSVISKDSVTLKGESGVKPVIGQGESGEIKATGKNIRIENLEFNIDDSVGILGKNGVIDNIKTDGSIRLGHNSTTLKNSIVNTDNSFSAIVYKGPDITNVEPSQSVTIKNSSFTSTDDGGLLTIDTKGLTISGTSITVNSDGDGLNNALRLVDTHDSTIQIDSISHDNVEEIAFIKDNELPSENDLTVNECSDLVSIDDSAYTNGYEDENNTITFTETCTEEITATTNIEEDSTYLQDLQVGDKFNITTVEVKNTGDYDATVDVTLEFGGPSYSKTLVSDKVLAPGSLYDQTENLPNGDNKIRVEVLEIDLNNQEAILENQYGSNVTFKTDSNGNSYVKTIGDGTSNGVSVHDEDQVDIKFSE